MRAPGEKQPKRVFVAYSQADRNAANILYDLRDRYDVDDGTTALVGNSLLEVLQDRITQCDVALFILPSSKSSSLQALMMSAGFAMAMKRPVILCGDMADIGSLSAVVPVIQKDNRNALTLAIDAAPRRRRNSASGESTGATPTASGLTAQQAEQARHSLAAAHSETDLVAWLAQSFRNLGATLQPGEREMSASRADLVLWSEALEPTFSLPLLIEVKTHLRTDRGSLQQYLSLLDGAGSRNMLVVAKDHSGKAHRWSEGSRSILLLDADLLVSALTTEDLTASMRALLDTAEPVR